MKFLYLVIGAIILFAFLAVTENTNFQVVGILLGFVAVPLFLVLRKRDKKTQSIASAETSASDYSRRRFVLLGGFLGLSAYASKFINSRIPVADMTDYKPKLVPSPVDLKLPAQSSFSLSKPQPSLPDGPYYAFDTPETRKVAASGTPGQPMVFQGRIVDIDGNPVDGAIIEIWHADGNGDYDNEEFNCRGHQFTNADGCFEFQTVKPYGYGKRSLSFAGVIDYRAAHLHVKMKKDNRKQTTQIWFPDDPRNATDVAYDRVKDVATVNQGFIGGMVHIRFDFIL